MRYLAIDPGDKRTGLAVGDDETGIVTPVDVLAASSHDDRIAKLVAAIAEHEPDALIVGLPLNMDGSEGPSAQRARDLGDDLARRTGKPVHMIDERLSSYAADQHMAQTGLTHKQKKLRRDAMAAMVLLNDFLRNRGTPR